MARIKLKSFAPADSEVMKKYPGIVAWGRHMLSYDYYIINECYEAQKDNAPSDAIYKDSDTGKWRCVSDLHNADMREEFTQQMRVIKETV